MKRDLEWESVRWRWQKTNPALWPCVISTAEKRCPAEPQPQQPRKWGSSSALPLRGVQLRAVGAGLSTVHRFWCQRALPRVLAIGAHGLLALGIPSGSQARWTLWYNINAQFERSRDCAGEHKASKPPRSLGKPSLKRKCKNVERQHGQTEDLPKYLGMGTVINWCQKGHLFPCVLSALSPSSMPHSFSFIPYVFFLNAEHQSEWQGRLSLASTLSCSGIWAWLGR